MTATTPLETSLYAGAASAYLIEFLKKWDKTPWITEHSKWLTTGIRLALSGASALGVSWAWGGLEGGGHSLTITIPALSVIFVGLWHWFGQYALTHLAGGVLKATELKPPAIPAETK